MSEQDVRDGLRLAVADEPPLSFDPEAVIVSARQAARRRRALVMVGVATTAIAVAAVALPATLGGQPGGEGHPAAERASVTSEPPALDDIDWPPPHSPARHYTAAELLARDGEMRARLRTTLPAAVPAATDLAIEPFQGEAAGHVEDGQGYLNTFATFSAGGTRFSLGISVFAPGEFDRSVESLCAAPNRCEQLGRRGTGVLVSVTEGGGAVNMQMASVYHLRDDGSVTYASGYNYDATSSGPLTYAPKPPVTVEQLAELAADPVVGL